MAKPFKSDGCSGSFMCLLRIGWRVCFHLGLANTPLPPWEADCEVHDLAYHPGGTMQQRMEADVQLVLAIAAHGYPALARAVFFGISIGGVWWLPLPWRWGFGEKYPMPYTKTRRARAHVTEARDAGPPWKLSADEEALARRMLKNNPIVSTSSHDAGSHLKKAITHAVRAKRIDFKDNRP